ncbi:hypothetical protein TWF694_003734 [Orbilia ellipsospora]|uniref:Uncharacterized protein n=1 Tax=Orbilia ellipsospora TaxID=2528407 RepID=A0AAV9WZ45_9PEZI
MSLFNSLASIAASTLTSALLEANPIKASGNSHNNKQTVSDAQQRIQAPPTAADTAPRIVELSSPLPGPRDPASLPRPRSRRQEASIIRTTPQESPNMSGLPLNSIWTTMSYPIPRGPCLQKSSLISACSCQRFMVHPLKATTSFDCDGCGHHASFHRMKSHEEEVENAAKFRESMMNVQGQLSSSPRNAANNNSGERRLLRDSRVEEVGEEEEDDDTLDGEEYGDQVKKRRAITNREGSEGASEGTSAGRRTRKAVAVSSSRGGKRKRNGDQILIE